MWGEESLCMSQLLPEKHTHLLSQRQSSGDSALSALLRKESGAGAECGNGLSLLGPVEFWGTVPSERPEGWSSDSKTYAEFIKTEVNLIVTLRKAK